MTHRHYYTRTRVYKRHGQVTEFRFSKVWSNFIVDCGAFYMKHQRKIINGKMDSFYVMGMYDDKGYFTSYSYVRRDEFVRRLSSIRRSLRKYTSHILSN